MVFSILAFKHSFQNKDPEIDYTTRHVSVGNKDNFDVFNGRTFPRNKIDSSKYTFLNFIPKNLFEQFHRIANVYFLLVAIVCFFVDTSVNPWTTLAPLIFVVAVTAIKQGYEDFQRHRSDKEVNEQMFRKVADAQLKDVQSKNIRVGDIIQVKCNQEVPCDLLLLSSSEEQGLCYITTANLDGETNLKTFTSLPATSTYTSPSSFENLHARVECELPNMDLYDFVGKICISDYSDDGNGKIIHLDGDKRFVIKMDSVDSRGGRGSRGAGGKRYSLAQDPLWIDSFETTQKRKTPHTCNKPSSPPLTASTYSLNVSNLLLRGTRLKNTEHIYGCAIYTSHETKISMNGNRKSQKYSKVEKTLNSFLIFYIILLMVVSVVWEVMAFFYYKKHGLNEEKEIWYLNEWPVMSVIEVIRHFFYFMVLFNYIIPISMYVTVEMQKFFCSIFFEWDVELYDEQLGRGAKANISDLMEELGQVEYLFADKTGTLTKNEMKFVKFFTKGHYYDIDFEAREIKEEKSGDGDDQVDDDDDDDDYDTDDDVANRVNEFVVSINKMVESKKDHTDKIESAETSDKGAKSVDATRMLECIALCHTAQIDKILEYDLRLQQKQQNQKRQHLYQASSPDEKALVEACASVGVVFEDRKNETITLSFDPRYCDEAFGLPKKQHPSSVNLFESRKNDDENYNHKETDNRSSNYLTVPVVDDEDISMIGDDTYSRKEYILHHVLHFDSTRKKMSVIIEERNPQLNTKEYRVICKGADSSVLECLKGSMGGNEGFNEELEDGEDDEFGESGVEASVNRFAKKGYRTLVYAQKYIDASTFGTYSRLLETAKNDINDREKKLQEAYKVIETDLKVLGSTAIEDQLQDHVALTLKDLRRAGIVVWVLTGDKEETAENVSFMAGHMTTNMVIYHVTKQSSRDGCLETIENFLEDIREKKLRNTALIVDGSSLTHAFTDDAIKNIFRKLCCLCCTVLCCRLSPIQKAQVVKMMKMAPSHPVTAAVGDGANDVSMILEAHLGIGIVGKEGKQAARSADISTCSFHHLRRIFLVHGQYFYTRLAILVLYFFYKNVVLTGIQILYTFHSAYSAQTYFSNFYLTFYNTTFTALPILLYGIFEKHISEDVLIRLPILYRKISRNKLLNLANFTKWNILAIFHAIVCFYGVFFILEAPSIFHNGWDIGMFDAGGLTFMACVLVVNLKLAVESYYFNWVIFGGYAVSILGFYILCLFNSGIVTLDLAETIALHWSFFLLLSAPSTWLLKVLLTATSLLPDFILRSIGDTFKSSYVASILFKKELKQSKKVSKNACLVAVVKRDVCADNETYVSD